MSEETRDFIERIKRITLQDFRGFKGTHTVDTDADLVLISGPNGHGKTSLLEGLTLLLTGWHDPAKTPADLIARDPAEPPKVKGRLPPEGKLRAGFSLSADARDADQRERTLTLSLKAANINQGDKKDTREESDGAGETEDAEKTAPSDPAKPTIPMPDGLPVSRLVGSDANDRELPARMCAFFQDRLDLLFDQAATGRTLRDVFEPLPRDVTMVLERLEKLREDLEGEQAAPRYRDDWTKKPLDALDEHLQRAWAVVTTPLQELAAILKEDWPKDIPPIPERIADDQELDVFASAIIDALGGRAARLDRDALRRTFRQTVENALAHWIAEAQRKASQTTKDTAPLQNRLDVVRSELSAIGQGYPTLDADIARFSTQDDALPNALDVFRALARHAKDWARPLDEQELPAEQRGKLKRVTEEFGLVSGVDAGKCAEALGTWLNARLEARAKRDRLREEEHDLMRAIERSLSSERLTKLRETQDRLRPAFTELLDAWAARHDYTRHMENTEGRRRAREEMKEALTAVKDLAAIVKDLTAASPEYMEQLRERAAQILWRFSLVEGVWPLHLVGRDRTPTEDRTPRVYDIRTGDGRLLQDLSTGQRAQVGVSLLVAQNLAATRLLHHRIILLDDVTTAYDLSNLTREAILWRQFAYGVADGSEQKRQIFISSHHEDMTNHLLDLLVPPPGRSMRLIRFTGWSNETGPEIETFQVEPSEDSPDPTLKAALEAF